MSESLFARVEEYTASLFAPADEVLEEVERSLAEAGMPPISVSPAEGKLLHVLARLCGARRILEVGTLAGYSGIWMARALPEDGRLVTIESEPRHAEVARRNFERAGLADRLDLRVGRGLDVLPALIDEAAGPFDMVFIDADKPPYTEYFELALRLARPGTLIVADNVIRKGDVLEPEPGDESTRGIQRFNAALAASPAVSAVLLQTVGLKGHDGMALAVVR